MPMIQIRDVPEDVHRRLKARAVMEGVSLSDLALAELRRSLDRPTRRELLEDATLVTTDARIAGAPGPHAKVDVIATH
ncbi:FitA-like ribbon-helix-helix domain-containing protein [Nocardioides sp. AE5]|uniref:FitA-like ribbon-helix-helix domain-containing protein n=1 Tax=Nocardioides sp. AE5 TaxID=2962573 RepID=UPI002882D232|nr:hypothetical protein [Nocardioides sp. AE5]MDT0203304.1 hypothetical protein [Nocardioides sp. AE5]